MVGKRARGSRQDRHRRPRARVFNAEVDGRPRRRHEPRGAARLRRRLLLLGHAAGAAESRRSACDRCARRRLRHRHRLPDPGPFRAADRPADPGTAVIAPPATATPRLGPLEAPSEEDADAAYPGLRGTALTLPWAAVALGVGVARLEALARVGELLVVPGPGSMRQAHRSGLGYFVPAR